MNRRGVTLVELLVGLVTAVIIATVSAQILKAGILTYAFSVRQNEALTRTRKALGGEGAADGILRAVRAAYEVSALDAARVDVHSSTSAVLTSYYVTGGNLYRAKDGVGALHAEAVTEMTVNYYNINGSGQIVESTATASATLVTALVTLRGKTSKQKDYHLFSGTLLRNHP